MSVHAWLSQHTNVRDALYWEKIPGSNASGGHYTSWSANRRQLLQDAYDRAVANDPTGLVDPPPNLVHLADAEFPQNVISSAHAWDLYVATVAQSLAVEIHKRVSWTVTADAPTSLGILFDSRQLFAWDDAHQGYALDFTLSGCAMPAPPDCHWRFLTDNRLISAPPPVRRSTGVSPAPKPQLELSHRRHTIALLVEWCRANMTHYAGPYITASMKHTWQYDGFAPVSRVIAGTHGSDYSIPSLDFRHWTAGCHGTGGFLRAVLRAVNIPVAKLTMAGHAQPSFPTERCYMSHGDDPYDALAGGFPPATSPPYGGDALLIDQATYDSWYGAGIPDATKAKNVAKRPQQLALTYLPVYLLSHYCLDKAAGTSHALGYVATEIMGGYSLAELNAADLWAKMDARIATYGGCAAIPGI
jgi:hypothetical protein